MKSPIAGEQFVTDEQGKTVAVVLDIATYERLREVEEDLADIRAFDEACPQAEAEMNNGLTISLEDYRAQRASRGK